MWNLKKRKKEKSPAHSDRESGLVVRRALGFLEKGQIKQRKRGARQSLAAAGRGEGTMFEHSSSTSQDEKRSGEEVLLHNFNILNITEQCT